MQSRGQRGLSAMVFLQRNISQVLFSPLWPNQGTGQNCTKCVFDEASGETRMSCCTAVGKEKETGQVSKTSFPQLPGPWTFATRILCFGINEWFSQDRINTEYRKSLALKNVPVSQLVALSPVTLQLSETLPVRCCLCPSLGYPRETFCQVVPPTLLLSCDNK